MTSAYDQFVKANAIENIILESLRGVRSDDNIALESAERNIHRAFRAGIVPKEMKKEISDIFDSLDLSEVAVRSSATVEDSSSASWAGELDSFLYVDKGYLMNYIKDCWASLFTARAIYYRLVKGLSELEASVAVVVQEMIESEVSGICFTVHPVTKDSDSLIVEAGWGLGEAIVGGMVTPDNYVISKSSLEITEKNIGNQKEKITRAPAGTQKISVAPMEREIQKLDDIFIIKLANICIAIENHYKIPQDIEWSYRAGKFYIVQSRPITTL